MDATTVGYAIALVLFVLVFLGIVAYTIATSRPRPQKELHGPEAIEAAIDRYDRIQRARWNPFSLGPLGWTSFITTRRKASRTVPGPRRKKARPRRHVRRHS